MTTGMTHDGAREALEALALDALDASERGAVLAHVAGCPECQDALAALEQEAAELLHAVQPIAMSPAQRNRVRSRLLARATAGRADQPSGSGDVVPIASAPSARMAPVRRPLMTRMHWMATAAGVVAIASLALLAGTRAERDALRQSLQVAAADRGARAAALDTLQTALADRDRLIANLTGPQVAVMTLASANPQAPNGRMFWDQAHDAWVFVAHNLPQPATGRTYQLWLVTPSAKISAGTFMPAASGDAIVRATYALPKDSLAAVAVTDEPAAGSAQPTTTPFLVAAK